MSFVVIFGEIRLAMCAARGTRLKISNYVLLFIRNTTKLHCHRP